MYHGNGTRSIVVNSAEVPDYIPNPQPDPIGYDRYGSGRSRAHRYRQHRGARYWKMWLIVGIFVFVVIFLAFIIIKSFFEYKYEYDSTFRNIVDLGTNFVTAVFFIAVAVVLFSIVGGIANLMLKLGIVELPGGMIAHIFDLVLDWRRSGSRDMAQMTIGRHFDVQTVLAEQSRYRNVTTYSPAIHYAIRADDYGSGDQRGIASFIVPSFSEMMQSGIFGDGSDLVLGIAGDDDSEV